MVRLAKPADLPTVVGFIRDLHAHDRPWRPDYDDPDRAAEPHTRYLLDEAAATGGATLVAVGPDGMLCGVAVGFVVSADPGDVHLRPAYRRWGEVTDLWVAPEARDRGVGRALVDGLATHFRGLGLHRMVVAVQTGNLRACTAYRRMGFDDTMLILHRDL